MTRAESRIVLGTIVLFATPLAYMLFFVAFERSIWPADDEALLAANIATGALFVVCWVLLWRRAVVWTSARRFRTWVYAFGGVLPAVGCYAIATAITREDEIGQICAGVCWLTVWVASTTLLWRETPEERGKRLVGQGRTTLPCPRCAYNMTGLHQARCPERGTQFTLDELFGSLTSRGGGLTDDGGS